MASLDVLLLRIIGIMPPVMGGAMPPLIAVPHSRFINPPPWSAVSNSSYSSEDSYSSSSYYPDYDYQRNRRAILYQTI